MELFLSVRYYCDLQYIWSHNWLFIKFHKCTSQMQKMNNKQKGRFLFHRIHIKHWTLASLAHINRFVPLETVLYSVCCVKCALHTQNCLLILFFYFFLVKHHSMYHHFWFSFFLIFFLLDYSNFPYTHCFVELHTLFFLLSNANSCRHFFPLPQRRMNDTNALSFLVLNRSWDSAEIKLKKDLCENKHFNWMNKFFHN